MSVPQRLLPGVFIFAATLLSLVAASSPAEGQSATYVWEMQATEDQVNNYMGSVDGSTDSGATAHVLIEYFAPTGRLHYEMIWQDLEWDLTKIHLHGPAGPHESVMPHLWNVFTEEPDVEAAGVDRRNDRWVDTVALTEVVPGTPYLVTPGILLAMVDEQGYMNFHTHGFPMGEIRGNLKLTQENVPVTRAHRRCVERMQHVRERAVRVWDRHLQGCFASPESAGSGATLADCVSAGSRQTAALPAKIEDAYQTSCWGFDREGYLRFPAFGGGRAAAVEAVTQSQATGLVEDLFGAGTSMSDDATTATCQGSVLRAGSFCSEVVQREFRRCTRTGLRGARGPAGADLPFDGPEDMALCLGEDANGRIAQKCDSSAGRGDPVRRNLASRCTASGVDPAVAFPGCLGDARACVVAAARCRACLTIAGTTDDLAPDCETFDDGLDNGSCGS